VSWDAKFKLTRRLRRDVHKFLLRWFLNHQIIWGKSIHVQGQINNFSHLRSLNNLRSIRNRNICVTNFTRSSHTWTLSLMLHRVAQLTRNVSLIFQVLNDINIVWTSKLPKRLISFIKVYLLRFLSKSSCLINWVYWFIVVANCAFNEGRWATLHSLKITF